MITLLEVPQVTGEQLAEGYERLLHDKAFLSMIKGATTDTQILRQRIEQARELLLHAEA